MSLNPNSNNNVIFTFSDDKSRSKKIEEELRKTNQRLLILAIADAYDAMTNDRPYRKAMLKAEAFKELKKWAGSQFAPELVEKFLIIMK